MERLTDGDISVNDWRAAHGLPSYTEKQVSEGIARIQQIRADHGLDFLDIDMGEESNQWVEWDIDNNLPLYTRDLLKSITTPDGHFCQCHRGVERCYGCESIDCKFHSSGVERTQT